MKKVNRKKGFTLIELIVVIAILGILAAIAVPRLTGFKSNAATKADEASIRTMQSAISIAEAEGVLDLSQSAASAPNAASIRSKIEPAYLAAIPKSQSGAGWVVTIAGGPTATPAGPYTVTITVGTTAALSDWDN